MAGSIATGNPWLLLSAVWMTVFYVALAHHEEARFDRSMFAEAYHAYRRNTGMLVPPSAGGAWRVRPATELGRWRRELKANSPIADS